MHDETSALSLVDARRLAACFLPAGVAAELTIGKLPATGFSGSPVWLLAHEQTGGRYVLKRLPAAVVPEQIAWAQHFARHLAAAGLAAVSIPLPPLDRLRCESLAGSFAADNSGQLWQCLTFRPGQPVKAPTPEQAVAAATALAEVHRAAASFRQSMPTSRSTGWQIRKEQLAGLAANGFARPSATPPAGCGGPSWQRLVAAHRQAAFFWTQADAGRIAGRVAGRIWNRSRQPVLRDCWWAHLLFAEAAGAPEVSGLIDLDAAAVDAPAVDLARLLGSWQLESGDPAPRLRERWPEAFRQYAAIARPAGDFPTDVEFLHDTGIVCGLARWFDWLFVEKREFPGLPRVAGRVEALARALPATLARLSEA